MILALDFDGVLHPVTTTTEPKFCRLDLLERWLRERPTVDVVISSSWREVHSLDFMQSFFADDLQPRVIGATPLAHRLLGPSWFGSDAERAVAIGERQYEIEQWNAESDAPARPWAALDDDPSLFRPDCQTLVLCASEVGLTEAELEQLDAKFGFGQISSLDPPRMLTTLQAAVALNVSRAHVLQLATGNAFKGAQFTKGRHLRIPAAEVERVCKSMKSGMRKAIDAIARITADAASRELEEAKRAATRQWVPRNNRQ